MNHASIFNNLIAATLDAMQLMLETARHDVITAQNHIRAGDRNAAIGSVLPVADVLKHALALHEAVIAMHRFNRKEAP